MNKKGFTFIEVIIIFTIVFIMTAVLISTSYKERARKEVETVAREVTASIRETQNYALTGKQKGNDKMPCSFSFVPSSTGYQLIFESREIDGVCTGATEPFFDKMMLSNDVKMTITNANASGNDDGTSNSGIKFKVPYGEFSSVVENSKGIDIKLEKNEKYYHICVHATGLVEELGFHDKSDDFICTF